MPRDLRHLTEPDPRYTARRQFAGLAMVPRSPPPENSLRMTERDRAVIGCIGSAEARIRIEERRALMAPYDGGFLQETEADRRNVAEVKLLQADLARRDAELGIEGWPGALSSELPDDDLHVLGLPTKDYGTLPGPAQGGPLRESRAAAERRRLALLTAVAVFALLALAGALGLLS